MKKIPQPPAKIDPQKTASFLERFIKDQLRHRFFNKVLIGLSGGVDSAVIASLAVRSVGAGQVTALILPHKKLTGDDSRDAIGLAKNLRINYQVIEISRLVTGYFQLIKEKKADLLRVGNLIARQRMAILYDFSKKLQALVIGTSNRTELLLGYGTLYGDLACAFMPLAGLYKTQVYQLAKFLDIPKKILLKVPSARLWPGQTDEKELGISYEKVDRLLYLMIDKKLSRVDLMNQGYSDKIIKNIEERIAGNIFKLQLPAVPHLPPVFRV